MSERILHKLFLTNQAKADLEYWVKNNPQMLPRIYRLIDSAKVSRETGIGRPERLKHFEVPTWSRRITSEHRLVYSVKADCLFVLQLRHHY